MTGLFITYPGCTNKDSWLKAEKRMKRRGRGEKRGRGERDSEERDREWKR